MALATIHPVQTVITDHVEGVVAGTAREGVVASFAAKGVVAGRPGQDVVCIRTDEILSLDLYDVQKGRGVNRSGTVTDCKTDGDVASTDPVSWLKGPGPVCIVDYVAKCRINRYLRNRQGIPVDVGSVGQEIGTCEGQRRTLIYLSKFDIARHRPVIGSHDQK